MKLSEVLKISMTFVGTVIGAGFASGREIALYFKDQSYLSVVVAGVLLGFFCWVFAELGRLGGQKEMLPLLFPRSWRVAKLLVELANFITFIAMIAGAELVLSETFHITGGGVFSAILAYAVLLKGNEGLKILNAVIVPVIIIAVLGLSFKVPIVSTTKLFSLISPLSYASMNLLTGGYLIGMLTKERSKKETAMIGIFVMIVSTLLLILIFKIVLVYKDAAMPVSALASSLNLQFVSGLMIYFAIFTTMASSLKVSAGNNTIKSLFVLAVGFVFSLIGFQSLVDRFYPMIGYLGIGLSTVALYRLARLKIGGFFQFRKKRLPETTLTSLSNHATQQHKILSHQSYTPCKRFRIHISAIKKPNLQHFFLPKSLKKRKLNLKKAKFIYPPQKSKI